MKKTDKGETFLVVKGAPFILLPLCADKEPIRPAVETSVIELASRGIRTLIVAKTDSQGRWTMMGLLTFLDPSRPDAKAVRFGIELKIITGDHQLVVV